MAGLRTVFNDDLGLPLIGGQVFTYDAGTSTPKDSYSDALFTTPNTNPIILDDAGSCDLYLKGVYRLRVLDVNGVLIDEQDNVSQADGQFDSVLANTVAIGELQTSVANIEDKNVIKTDVSNRATGYGKPTSATTYASLVSTYWRVATPTGVDMGELIFTTYDTERTINGATVAAGAYFNPDLIAKESITGDKIAKGTELNTPRLTASYADDTPDTPNMVLTATGDIRRSNDPLNAASRKVGLLGGNLVDRGTDGYPTKNNAIGVGQTWQNVLASRATNTSYTNTTGRTIFIAVATTRPNQNQDISITVDGLVVSSATYVASTANQQITMCAIVPNGSIYKVIFANTGIQFWSELR